MRLSFIKRILHSQFFQWLIGLIWLLLFLASLFLEKNIGNALTAISIIISIIFTMYQLQRNKRLEFLEDSYKKIAMGVDRSLDNVKFQEGLEEAIATIQLYGEPKLLATLKEVLIIKEKALGKVSPGLSPVLNELRNSLREEFKLEKVEDEVISFRSIEERKKIEEYNKQKL